MAAALQSRQQPHLQDWRASLTKEKHMRSDDRLHGSKPAPGASWLVAIAAACALTAGPTLAQQPGSPPKPTVGEGQGPRQDGTTRSGAAAPAAPAAPASAASAAAGASGAKGDGKASTGALKGTSIPRPSDSGSILGTPK
jgi:hypothetical protein